MIYSILTILQWMVKGYFKVKYSLFRYTRVDLLYLSLSVIRWFWNWIRTGSRTGSIRNLRWGNHCKCSWSDWFCSCCFIFVVIVRRWIGINLLWGWSSSGCSCFGAKSKSRSNTRTNWSKSTWCGSTQWGDKFNEWSTAKTSSSTGRRNFRK